MGPPYSSLEGVRDGVQVHRALIGEVVKDVHSLLRCAPSLLAPEHKVDPLVQMAAHMVALQRPAMQLHEALGGAVGPLGQLHFIHLRCRLRLAQRVVVQVPQKVLVVVELWDELLDIVHDIGSHT